MARSFSNPSAYIARLTTLGLVAVLALVGCRQMFNPLDPSSPGFAGEEVLREPAPSVNLPAVERWESLAQHGGEQLLGLEISDAAFGEPGYFVEPRNPSDGGGLYVALSFSGPVTPEDFRDVLVAASSFSGGATQYGVLEPEWFLDEDNRVAFRIGVITHPTSIRIRLAGPNSVIFSQREFSVLPGDINGDLVVDGNDQIPDAAAGDVTGGSAAAAIRADLNADGTVEPAGVDLAIRDANAGALIAAPAPVFVDDPPPPAPLSYTLTYDPNGADAGSVPSAPRSYIAGTSATILGNTNGLTRDGAAFVGWNTAADGSGTGYNPGDSLVVTQSITLYAEWSTFPTFSVTYLGNGADGGTPPATSNYEEAESVTVQGNVGSLFRSGFRFAGWKLNPAGSAPDYVAGDSFPMPPAPVELHAHWIPVYGVTYDANGATGGSVPTDSSEYAAGESVTARTNSGGLARTGFRFVGWNELPDGSGFTVLEGDSFAMPAADVTLYALWEETFTITYNDNGADGGSVPTDSNTYIAGEDALVADNTGALTRAGFSFVGWNTVPSGGVATRYVGGSTFTMGSADVVLYAEWSSLPTYTVTYDRNGAPAGDPPGPSTYNESDPVDVLGSGTLAWSGFEFDGWNTVADGSGTAYTETDTFPMPPNDITLYAQWVAVYTVNYLANGASGGTVPSDPNFYRAGDSVEIDSDPNSLFRTGHTFEGWNVASDGSGTRYNFGQIISMPAGNLTLFAEFAINLYTLTFDANGGAVGAPPAPIDAFYNTTIAIPGNGTLTRAGFEFAGWNTAPDGSGAQYNESDSFTVPASDTTLYAQWEAVYTISYNPNGAAGGSAPAPQSSPAGSSVTLAMNTGSLSLPNFVLGGWNTAADGSGTSYALGAPFTMPASNVTLYAQWRLDVSGGGLGTSAEPYRLLNADDLNMVRHDLDAHYAVAANIDMNVAPYNSGTGWVPIGTNASPFTGTFDGGYPAYKISGLFINDTTISGNDGAGLFGRTVGAMLQNVALEDVSITADDTVGGLVGWPSGGTMIRSYTTGTVEGGSWVGGLVGYLEGMVEQSFSAAVVTGGSWVGGLVGAMTGSAGVYDSSAYGGVTGGSGFVGDGGGTIARSFSSATATDQGFASGGQTTENSFFDQDRAGVTDTSAAVALTTAQALQQASYPTFDFGSVWTINDGVSYPYHQWYTGPQPLPAYRVTYDANGGVNPPAPSPFLPEGDPVTLAAVGAMSNGSLALVEWNEASDGSGVGYSPGDTIPMPSGGLVLYAIWAPVFAGGDGSALTPYQIATADQLSSIRYNLGAHYQIVANIDLNTAPYNTGSGWEPIGTSSTPFNGSLDGQGYVVANLFIDTTAGWNGLFGLIRNGSVTNLVLDNANVTGAGNTGVLAGQIYDGDARIYRVGATGSVSASDPENYNIGGLVGHVWDGTAMHDTIVESYAQVTVNGGSNVGGLVGFLAYGTIRNSYAYGQVSGEANAQNGEGFIGGLVGQVSSGEVTQSYSAGLVTSSASHVGGFTGDDGGLSGGSNYYDQTSTSQTGSTVVYQELPTADMIAQATYVSWDFATVWETPGPHYPYLQWQGATHVPVP